MRRQKLKALFTAERLEKAGLLVILSCTCFAFSGYGGGSPAGDGQTQAAASQRDCVRQSCGAVSRDPAEPGSPGPEAEEGGGPPPAGSDRADSLDITDVISAFEGAGLRCFCFYTLKRPGADPAGSDASLLVAGEFVADGKPVYLSFQFQGMDQLLAELERMYPREPAGAGG